MFTRVFLSVDSNKVSDLSLLLSSLYYSLLQNETKSIFYLRGLFELFPPIYLPYSIALNGLSSPQIGSRSQHLQTLKTYLFYVCAKHGLMVQ
jgi:hypothetical protein